jgi:hypothetical protein
MTDIKWPEGATHKIDDIFKKWVDGSEYFYSKDNGWARTINRWQLAQYKMYGYGDYEVIERPIETVDPIEIKEVGKPIDPPYVPKVGEWCEGHTTDAALNWRWLSVERLKDMGNGEFACLVDDKYLRFVDTFRPIKTEREKFIEKGIEINRSLTIGATETEMFVALFEAGFKAPE